MVLAFYVFFNFFCIRLYSFISFSYIFFSVYMNDYIQYVTSDFLAGLGFGATQMLGEVEVTLDTSTSSSASAEMIAPALQGATLSDGQLKDGAKGIRIDNVEKSSPAAQAGLHKDDVIIAVNRDRVNSIAEMRKVLETKPSIIALQVVRGNESIYLLLR